MHQNMIKGKKVLLIFKDGHQEIGKFRKAEKGTFYFSDHDPVRLKHLRCITYLRPSEE